jgi:8-oxo-dGTP diphosphatase
VDGDGSGWVECPQGHRHWGRFGAAGLLAHASGPDGRCLILLQLRARWSHQGGTWGLPGGARDSDETPEQAALREAAEEATVDPNEIRVHGAVVDDACGWAYTTVLARAASAFPVAPANAESDALTWVPAEQVADLPLHPRFATMWPGLRAAVEGAARH